MMGIASSLPPEDRRALARVDHAWRRCAIGASLRPYWEQMSYEQHRKYRLAESMSDRWSVPIDVSIVVSDSRTVHLYEGAPLAYSSTVHIFNWEREMRCLARLECVSWKEPPKNKIGAIFFSPDGKLISYSFSRNELGEEIMEFGGPLLRLYYKVIMEHKQSKDLFLKLARRRIREERGWLGRFAASTALRTYEEKLRIDLRSIAATDAKCAKQLTAILFPQEKWWEPCCSIQ